MSGNGPSDWHRQGLWKPMSTPLPDEWSSFVRKLTEQASDSLQMSPTYILDVRYNAMRVGDQACQAGLPWFVVMAGYLWEYNEDIIRQFAPPDCDLVVNCIRQAMVYTRDIAEEHLPPLLTPPYDDLGALLLTTIIYFQTLKQLQEQSGDRQYKGKQQASIESVGQTLRNIFKRLGLWHWKRDIEDVSEQLHAPRKFKTLKKELASILQRDSIVVEKARQFLENVYQETTQHPILVVPVACNVSGLRRRQQSLLGTSQKRMLNSFDLVTFDVIVPTVHDCFDVFGILSHLGRVQERVIEQITDPKPNGNSNISLKLYLQLPDESAPDEDSKEHPVYPCNLHIATPLMNAITWYGCLHPACYPIYSKASNNASASASTTITQVWQSEAGKVFVSIQDALSRNDVLPNEETPVVVFEKNRQFVHLPKGATALDFAYAVGSGTGSHAAEIFVNTRPSPLYRELDAGDVVEIRTANDIQAQEHWLSYAKTPQALREIRTALNVRGLYRRGYNQLHNILEQHHYMLTPDTLDDELQQVAKQFNIGYSELLERLDKREETKYTPQWVAEQIMEQIAEINEPSPTEMPKMSWMPVLDRQVTIQLKKIRKQKLCGICSPTYPHDMNLLGRLRKRTGVLVVHKENCPHLIDSHSIFLPMNWEPEPPAFRVSFFLISQDRKGLVLDLTKQLLIHRCELLSLYADVAEFGQARVRFKVEVHTHKEVFAILRTISSMDGVIRAEIDAAATSQRILDRLRTQPEIKRTPDSEVVEYEWKEAMSTLASRNTRLRNPFDISHSATPRMFFGRSQEIATIQEHLCNGESGKGIILYGPLRSGKSSICSNFIQQHLSSNHTNRPIWGILFSLQNAIQGKEESLFQQLAESVSKRFSMQFQQPAPQWNDFSIENPQSRFQHIIQECVAKVPHSRLIIALDEFGGAIESFDRGALPFSFFSLWKELLEHISQVSLLFALPTSSHITLNSHQFANVFSFMKDVPVTYLDTISAQQLLIDPLRERNIEVHPATVALALKLTGGSPYYMTILGQHLIDYLNKLPHLQLINDVVLRAVMDQIVNESTGYNFTYLKQELLQEEEFRILEGFVYLSEKIKQSKVQCKLIANWLNMPVHDTRKHLDRLRQGLIFDETGPGSNPYYSFKIELVRRWLLRHRDFFHSFS
ncbi:MAG: hypothetical protein NVS4B1_21830 [Ktedonobacteraceae bacterium]